MRRSRPDIGCYPTQETNSRVSWHLQTCSTVELHLSVLIGTASHPDMQKIRIIGLFFENMLHWQFAVPLLLFTVRTCV